MNTEERTIGSGAGRRPRVLVVAEAANPRLYSVSLIGWSYSQALSRVADVHLVSESRNAPDILAAGTGAMAFTPIDNRRLQHAAWRMGTWLRGGDGLGWGTYSALSALVYPFFERRVWQQFKERLRRGEFDVVHRITPNSPATPSLLARMCARHGVPFVLGPINGGVPWPKEYPEMRKAEREWLSPFRSLARLQPGYIQTRKSSSAILVGARFALLDMPRRFHDRCVYLPENAVDVARFPRQPPPEASTPLRVAFVGRLVPVKGADMLLEAVAPLARSGTLVLDIIGDGPERPRLMQMAGSLGLGNTVQFPGWVKHEEMAGRLRQSQVFAFPSVREFGGGVVLEAMALGLVPVVVNYAGPGELVPEGTGFALTMGPREMIITQLRERLAALASAPAMVAEMGIAAQAYVYRNFTWDAKAMQTLEIYRWVMKQRADKPDFGVPLA